MSKVNAKAPYCIICDKQIHWQDKVVIEVGNYSMTDKVTNTVSRVITDKLFFHRKCFNNSEFARLLGKDMG